MDTPDIRAYDEVCANIPLGGGDVLDVFNKHIEFVASVISADVYTPKFVDAMDAIAYAMASAVPMEERAIAREIFCRKNTERQSGWQPVGARGAFIEILSKIQRIGSCIHIEETVSDAIRDMFNYCIIVKMCIATGNIIGHRGKFGVWMEAGEGTTEFAAQLDGVLRLNGIETRDANAVLVDVLCVPVKTIHCTRMDSKRIVISVPAGSDWKCNEHDIAYAARLLIASFLYPRIYR